MISTSVTRWAAGTVASLLVLSGIVVAAPAAAVSDAPLPPIAAAEPDFWERDAPQPDQLIIPSDSRFSYFINGRQAEASTYVLPIPDLGLEYDSSGILQVTVTANPIEDDIDLEGASWSFTFYGCNPVAKDSSVTSGSCRVSSDKPTITGKALVGTTLKAKTGTWAPAPLAFSYQWKRDGKSISGATKSSYKITSKDAGKKITVTVTGSRDGYAKGSKTSSATAKVLGTMTAATPKISGTAKVGSTLKASAGTWKPGSVKFSYQWKRDGKSISGATKSSYKVTSKDAGKKITVTVKGSKSGHQSASKTSKAKSIPGKLSPGKPKITGSAKVGSTLKANAGTWKPGSIKFSYQWKRDGKSISGATKSSYKVTSKDAGSRLSVTVKGKKSGYSSASKTSSQTSVVKYPTTAKPSGWNCPSWAPIKGNASSMIYHMPGGAYYSRTNPEECFATRSAAVNHGYRASQR